MKSLEIHFLTDCGGGGWFAAILVRKGDYFLILCKKLFQNVNNCNYDQNSS